MLCRLWTAGRSSAILPSTSRIVASPTPSVVAAVTLLPALPEAAFVEISVAASEVAGGCSAQTTVKQMPGTVVCRVHNKDWCSLV